ncbi:uncharacterized protein LOC108909690 [Anoplophora glabripennis]|uniref:uncharacterized protein LOC108909690 n=1 Tax=Anoplophora glabripennis TaxID=217634 RepID=UPI00087386AE|nr:uncharacterized protein LOC108909690 [Anoplophora glabripennis]
MVPTYSAYVVLCNLLFAFGALKSSYSVDDTIYFRYRRQTGSSGCTIPPHPEHGRWKLLNGEANPGDTVQIASILTFECNAGYKLSSKIPSVCLGEWSSPVPECEELCPPLYSSNTYDLKCVDKLGKEINCTEATHGTNLEYTCKTYYETPFGYKKTLFCENGKWDNSKPVCQPVCGKKVTNDTKTLIYGSKPNEKIEHPWVAAVYQKVDDSFENICGGSILSQTVILTAAHCVTNDYGDVLPKENYMVGVGKLYRRYQAPQDTRAQYLELSKIIVPEAYKGDIRKYAADIAVLVVKEEMSINEKVQPVCFTNMKNIHLHAGNKGEVSGWGLAEGEMPSEVLRSLVIPYKYETVCADELPSEWADRYNLKDKICVGFVNKSTSVCSGDSGGGLAFKYREDNRYYIHGIVSVSHQVGYMCNIQQNALYTSVASYYEFVDRLLTKYAPKVRDCILPAFPQNGKWTTEQGKWKPGDAVPSSTILTVECDEGFVLSSKRSVDCTTAHNLPSCEMLCPKPTFPTETYYKCINREGQDIACSSAIEGSHMWYSCPSKYTQAEGSFNRTCSKGSWGLPKPECTRECGKKVVDDSGIGSEYPWNVGIYKLDDNLEEKYGYACGGSLVSEYVIVTATQCVTDELGDLMPREKYLVAAGKHYRKFNDSRDMQTQISDITYINVHPGYKATEKTIYNIALVVASKLFRLNNFVQPVCITDLSDFWFRDGDAAMMIGWRGAETLKSLEIENKPDDGCALPSAFKRLFFSLDNTCAEFKNGSSCLLPEDRGKGIVAKHPEDDRYYIHAVATYYESKECQKKFWIAKISSYSNVISCTTSRL